MADKREVIWRRCVSEGSVPCWLVDWIGAARALPATELPGYAVFRQLLAEQEIEAAAAAAEEAAVAAKVAEAAPAAHLLWAEE